MFVLLTFYLLVFAAARLLDVLNLRHLRRHGGEIPPAFAGAVDASVLERTARYTVARNRVSLSESLVEGAALLLFFFGGVLPAYDRWIAGVTGSFIGGGVLFFLGLILARTLLDIPFSLYRTFRLEKRFGFNTTTPRIWMGDLLKSTLLTLVLLGTLTAGALWLVQNSPDLWWLWVWGLVAAFTLILMYLSPYVIEPLFFTFEPLKRKELEEGVRDLMHRAGLTVSRVFQVDASRRSRHSNAYFTGLGRVKRIVLFDTLLEQMDDREILAVLAHEVGHWKLKHVVRRLLGSQIILLATLWLAHRLVGWEPLPSLVGAGEGSFAARATLLLFLGTLGSFPLTPIASALSRRHERQADRFASQLTGRPGDLASALVKLSRENLANLHPHPLYAWFHYSHPPMARRVEQLREESLKTSAS